MALADESIVKINARLERAEGQLRTFKNLDSYIEELNKNEDYLVFVNNTELGASLNSNLLKLRDIAYETGETVDALYSVTHDFLDLQAKLNKNSPGSVSENISSRENSNTGVSIPGGNTVPDTVMIPGGHSIPSSGTWYN